MLSNTEKGDLKRIDVHNGEWSCFPYEIMEGLKPNMQLVYAWLVRHRNRHTGACYPSYKKLAKECGVSRATIIKTLKQLEKERLIRVLKKSGSNNYYLLATNFVDVYDQNVDHLPVKDVDYINRLSKTPSDNYKPQTPMIP
jgi:DNA-binding transcriptional MocR family regulator